MYPGVDTSRYVGVAGPPPSHVTGYQLNGPPAETHLTNNTKRRLTTLMDFPAAAAATLGDFEGSEAPFFAEKKAAQWRAHASSGRPECRLLN